MASKNHSRYKIRKRMNTPKQYQKVVGNEPPVLIDTWDELDGLENDKYRIVVNERRCAAMIEPKSNSTDECEFDSFYLSTHTFYGSQYQQSTKLLQELGFNVQLTNWDKENVK